MANELILSLTARFRKSGSDVAIPPMSSKVDVTGTLVQHHRQSIGTSEEALDLGALSTGGWFIGKNHDATNFVEIRPGTGLTDTVKLKAGEFCAFRISGDASAPFAIADTGACELEYWLFED